MTSGSYPGREHTRTSTDPQQRWGLARRDEAPKPSLDSFSESASVSSSSGIAPPTDAQMARRLLERNGASPDVAVSTSLPNNLDQSGGAVSNPPPRANSELGHYSDGTAGSGSGGPPDHRASPPINVTTSSAGQSAARTRTSFHPARVLAGTPPDPRAASPEKDMKQKISGPIAGAPIPAGAKFGGEGHSNDRERKAKSRGFWGFGKTSEWLWCFRTVTVMNPASASCRSCRRSPATSSFWCTARGFPFCGSDRRPSCYRLPLHRVLAGQKCRTGGRYLPAEWKLKRYQKLERTV